MVNVLPPQPTQEIYSSQQILYNTHTTTVAESNPMLFQTPPPPPYQHQNSYIADTMLIPPPAAVMKKIAIEDVKDSTTALVWYNHAIASMDKVITTLHITYTINNYYITHIHTYIHTYSVLYITE